MGEGSAAATGDAVHAGRLAALRAELATQNLAGFIVPIADEHASEYVGAYAQRLAWLTGFTGSAGTAVVLADTAAIFTDGRYTLQVRAEVDGDAYAYEPVPGPGIGAWLAANAAPGARIGFDPWLHDQPQIDGWQRAAGEVELVAVARNPVDSIWTDRPTPSAAPARVHPLAAAGRDAADKRAAIAEVVAGAGAEVALITALDSVAWLLNLRGEDVSHTPVTRAFALAHADATADLFIAPEKLTPTVRQHLGNSVRLHPYSAVTDAMRALQGRRVAVDPARTVVALRAALDAGGAVTVPLRDPVLLPKAVKNAAEIAGMRAAHERDGAAVTDLLAWLAAQPPGSVDELTVTERLAALRRERGALDASFDTIAGSGPNGAIIHYRADAASNRMLQAGELFLLDSGAQYADGTTDITRTVAIGTPDAEMRRRFTQVLQGHIALDRAVFPEGTRGGQLDVLARAALWADGVDYAHGTGHGVGCVLAVHEGPQRIAKPGGGQAGTDEPLRPGMILSNEPGYYRPGAYGIRIENLVLVTPASLPDAEQAMLCFETLTLAPIARDLIDIALLSPPERAWIDAYHARVAEVLGPRVAPDTQAFLMAATRPLGDE